MRRIFTSFACTMLTAVGLTAQTPVPDTDIYIAPLRMRDGWVALGALRNVTNRAGYDNQPHFSSDGRSILYTARIGNTQTDIFRYDLRSNKSTQVTQTPESEYSPTPTPIGGFSVIRVEADSTQRLWRFNDNGSNPRVLLPTVRPIGYQAWMDGNSLVLFVLGSPATLRIGDVRTGRADSLAANIGRAIQKVPRYAGASFVQRAPDSTMWVQRVHGPTRAVRPIARLPAGGEYHAWTPRSALLATSGSKVLEWTPINGGSWREVADYAGQGIRLSRIAVSPRGDWIAVVGERPAAAR
ncbi:MAG: hypothetical protein WEE89_06665 [Gemmatimonadota bacterium]